MSQRDRELVSDTDPNELFFGPTDDAEGADEAEDDFWDEHPSGPAPRVYLSRHESRAERNRASRRKRNKRFALVLAVLLVALVAVSGWLIGVPVYHYFNPADYHGDGTGSVTVVVHSDESAADIADTLLQEHVVASVKAFTNAASDNPDSQSLQPGTYVLHRHMSAAAALQLMLDPKSRINSDITVFEGATVVDVEKRLTAPPCAPGSTTPRSECGLGLDKDAVVKALGNVRALGVPTDYTPGGKTPPSAEGFLYPATYPFDNKTPATAALGQMVAKFTDVVRSANFTARAKALGLTPYQELIIASIAQAEAKFPEDMPKVARVILNRLAANRNLQVDATSAYAAKLAGLDPSKTIYAETKGPYNTYTHAGLPPTPIGNPGEAALQAAAHPAKGNWMYYVNIDAQGHLGFFASDAAFEKAVEKCRSNGWCQ